MAYSGLNGQTHVVGSDYCTGIPSIAEVPISAPVLTYQPGHQLRLMCVHVTTQPLHVVKPQIPYYEIDDWPNMWPKRGVRTPLMSRSCTPASSMMQTLRRLEVNSPVRPVSCKVLTMAGSPYPDIERRPGHRPYARSESRRTPTNRGSMGHLRTPAEWPVRSIMTATTEGLTMCALEMSPW